ncbi:hypothetical protein ACJROX_14575 [Pseudalkalibacillus sp. A8]|uniref:hypothetical protein n=1 Tax=Pseudalkalibacillus sp. A8 TaxID=3382641 RepID=UPI0038B43289
MYKLVTLLSIFLLLGCVKENQSTIKEGSVKDLNKYTSVAEVKEDLDGNGITEKISLYVGPVIHKDAAVSSLADQTYWRLIVEDGDKTFSLINYKSSYNDSFDLWLEENGKRNNIIVFLGGHNKEIISYHYEDSRFIKEKRYKSKGEVKEFAHEYTRIN